MDSVPTWVLMDVQFRWVYLTPQVVPADPEEGRLSYVHKLHISFTTQSPSIPICGKYQAGEYHPWPLLKTRAIAQEDACVDCARALQKAVATAMVQANRLLYIQGSVFGIPTEPPPPPFSPAVVQQIGTIATLTQQLQGALGTLGDVMAQSNIHPPEALQPFMTAPLLLASPDNLEKLSTYERFHEWCAEHPKGFVAIPRPPGKLRVHKVTCRYVTEQPRHTFVDAFGALNATAIRTEFEREPDWCDKCLHGHAPPEDS